MKKTSRLHQSKVIYFSILSFLIFACSKKNGPSSSTETPPPPLQEINTTATIDREQKAQLIDGFGFFGAKSVWWDNTSNLYSDAWANQVINDMGITVWRSELYPPSTLTVPQDADWNKQKPVAEGLSRIATANKVPLKFIFTIWSPPAEFKCALSTDNNPISGTPNPGGTKNGGTLDPKKYVEFGNWIADGIQLYKNSNIDVYAISLQNEPLFKQTFNSCYYKPMGSEDGSYAKMIKNVVPVVKARFPNVKIFGSENMLEMEGGTDREFFYNKALINDAVAMSNVDILAVHGYSDGVSPTGSSKLATLWNTTSSEHANTAGKPYWMTETSGYVDRWKTTGSQSGAINLAMDIHAALYSGNAAAWVWWQGSDNNGINEFSLMKGTEQKGKKYYVSKHFYRFIRPGARRVKLSMDEAINIFGTAFENTAMGSFTAVLINNSSKKIIVNIAGTNVPAQFDYYLTTEASSDNCTKAATKVNKTAVTLPPYSVVTLVDGNVYE
jgi:glucuronoarabinoxylan endo-1,4-beta-xylanase